MIMQPKALEKMNILNNLITLNTVNISGMSIITKIKAYFAFSGCFENVLLRSYENGHFSLLPRF